MRKLILRIEDGISDELALRKVATVVEGGKVSDSVRGPQYCFVSIFTDKTRVIVTKQKSGTETFRVEKYEDD